jgi:hypothetical protein
LNQTISNKRFKNINGYCSSVSPVKKDWKKHNFAKAIIQTSNNTEENPCHQNRVGFDD